MGGVWAISIEKQNFDPWKSNINQNMDIRPHENIPLYSTQLQLQVISETTKYYSMVHVVKMLILFAYIIAIIHI